METTRTTFTLSHDDDHGDDDGYSEVREELEDLQEELEEFREDLDELQRPAINLPFIGAVHAPERQDVVYAAGVVALIAFGAVEWPIALAAIGGHALARQGHSRSLSELGKAMKDVLDR